MASTLNYVYETQPVSPVGGVAQVNKYRRQEEQNAREDASFAAVLAREKAKKQEDETVTSTGRNGEPLRIIAGMNQYNRQAQETFFILMNRADYRA